MTKNFVAVPNLTERMVRERNRLRKMSHLELFDELYGDSSNDIIDELMEQFEESVEANDIVPCSKCGQECFPEDSSDEDDAEWLCEKCGGNSSNHE